MVRKGDGVEGHQVVKNGVPTGGGRWWEQSATVEGGGGAIHSGDQLNLIPHSTQS